MKIPLRGSIATPPHMIFGSLIHANTVLVLLNGTSWSCFSGSRPPSLLFPLCRPVVVSGFYLLQWHPCSLSANQDSAFKTPATAMTPCQTLPPSLHVKPSSCVFCHDFYTTCWLFHDLCFVFFQALAPPVVLFFWFLIQDLFGWGLNAMHRPPPHVESTWLHPSNVTDECMWIHLALHAICTALPGFLW